MSMQSVIVFEARPRWAPELEREFAGQEIRIRTCGSLGDVARELTRNSGDLPVPRRSLAIIELSAAPAECLQFLGRMSEHGGTWPVIVIGSTRTGDLQWPIRELGVLQWLLDTVSGEDLARLCHWQFRPSRRMWKD